MNPEEGGARGIHHILGRFDHHSNKSAHSSCLWLRKLKMHMFKLSILLKIVCWQQNLEGLGLWDQESHFLVSFPHCLGVVLCPGKGQGTHSQNCAAVSQSSQPLALRWEATNWRAREMQVLGAYRNIRDRWCWLPSYKGKSWKACPHRASEDSHGTPLWQWGWQRLLQRKSLLAGS